MNNQQGKNIVSTQESGFAKEDRFLKSHEISRRNIEDASVGKKHHLHHHWIIISVTLIIVILIASSTIIAYIYFFSRNEGAKERKNKVISIDLDGDGLNSMEEAQIGTDPNSKDTDRDGYTDSEEVESGHDPLIHSLEEPINQQN